MYLYVYVHIVDVVIHEVVCILHSDPAKGAVVCLYTASKNSCPIKIRMKDYSRI